MDPMSIGGMTKALPGGSAPPFSLGRYDVLLAIGEGGTARVYLARAHGIGGFQREVAIKLLNREGLDERMAADLLDEAKLAVRIRHPHVVSVLDVGRSDGLFYLVMDYVEGETLSGLMRRAAARGKPLPLPLRVRVLLDALEGLHATHEALDEEARPLGLVHRDFTPQNILIARDGRALLGDFGLAKPAAREGRTESGIVKGKIRYMAPEQAQGQALDRRCDVWAAAVIAWEMFADRRLWEGDNEVAIALRLVSETPPLLGSLVADVPDAVDDVIAWGLVRDVQSRCGSAEVFRQRLFEACSEAGLIADRSEVAAFVESEMSGVFQERRRQSRALAERSSDSFAAAQPVTPKPVSRWPRTATLLAGPAIAIAATLLFAPRLASQPPSAPLGRFEASYELPFFVAPTPSANDGTLALYADRPIAKLVVDGIVVPIDTPQSRLVVPIAGDRGSERFIIEARSDGGQRATIEHEPGRREVHIRFSRPHTPARAPWRRPPGPSAPAAEPVEPLAPIPYGTKTQ